jgi:hypothetical protein
MSDDRKPYALYAITTHGIGIAALLAAGAPKQLLPKQS